MSAWHLCGFWESRLQSSSTVNILLTEPPLLKVSRSAILHLQSQVCGIPLLSLSLTSVTPSHLSFSLALLSPSWGSWDCIGSNEKILDTHRLVWLFLGIYKEMSISPTQTRSDRPERGFVQVQLGEPSYLLGLFSSLWVTQRQPWHLRSPTHNMVIHGKLHHWRVHWAANEKRHYQRGLTSDRLSTFCVTVGGEGVVWGFGEVSWTSYIPWWCKPLPFSRKCLLACSPDVSCGSSQLPQYKITVVMPSTGEIT